MNLKCLVIILAFDKKYIDLVWYHWQHTVSFNNMRNTGVPDYSYTKIYGDTNRC